MQNGRPARESRDARSRHSAGRHRHSSSTRSQGRSGSKGPAHGQGGRGSGSRSSQSRSSQSRSSQSRESASHALVRRDGSSARNAAQSVVDESGLIRLNKYLASHGIASRRGCDELIAEGAVMVDDHIVTDLGVKVDPRSQRVEVDGVVLKPEGVRHRYYLLNKPSGVVCTNSERELRPRAVDLITDRDKGRIFTVGRLDEETTGLILVTNDGEFANRVMHPRYGVDKTYRVKVAGRIEDAALRKIRGGVHLSDGRTSGARVLVQKRSATASRLLVTIQEGKNREVRRMFARAGFKVTDLRRVRIGSLTDRGLKPGSWRPLRRFEIEELLAGPEEREREERGEARRGGGARRGASNRPGGSGRSGRRGGGRDAGPIRSTRRREEAEPAFERRVLGEDDGRRGGSHRSDDRSGYRSDQRPNHRSDRDRSGRGGRHDDRRESERDRGHGRGRRDEGSGATHPARQSNRAARREALEARERSRDRRGEGGGGGRRVVS